VTVEGFLVSYGGALILPLAVIEGPIVSVVTGFLSARGYFDWYWALCLLIAADLIGDLIYYWIGRSGGQKLARFGWRLGARTTVSPELRRDLAKNAGKMLLIGKWTHSIGFLVLIGSGMLRVPLSRFLLINLLGTIPKSAVLLGLGYFAGDHFPFFENHAVLTTFILCAAGLAALLATLHRAGRFRASRSPS
jgi:membrane protein DedA with SNARE-associated domain